MGHDYSHYFARLLIGADYIWKNGFKIPYFTPYLCGGVPFHADPQQIFFSLPQLLAVFTEVLPATYLSFVVFYILGYIGMWKLCERVFSFKPEVSHFIALLFLLNGFSFNHLFVGHITHMPFLLAPWLLYFFFRCAIIPFSLILIYCLYSGALHILVVFGVMLSVCFPLVVKRSVEASKTKELVYFLFIVPLILCLTCSGKVMAALHYSPHFFMHTIDTTKQSGLFELVTRYWWANPFHSPQSLSFGNWSFGSWEFTAPISRLTLFLSILGLLVSLLGLRKSFWSFLSIFIVSAFFVGLSRGSSLNSMLPFLSHYHNPLKLLGGGIVPLLLLSGSGLNALTEEAKLGRSVFAVLSIFVLGEFFISSEFLVRTPHALGFHYPGPEFRQIRKAGGLPPVLGIVPGGIDDYSAMKAGKANLACYEPLFGYRREMFRAELDPRRSSLTHAGCLLYSKELGCRPWSLTEDPLESAVFAHGLALETWVPLWQKRLDSFNFIFMGLLFFFPFAERFAKLLMRKIREQPQILKAHLGPRTLSA